MRLATYTSASSGDDIGVIRHTIVAT